VFIPIFYLEIRFILAAKILSYVIPQKTIRLKMKNLNKEKQYKLFNIAESKGKLMLCLMDIQFVTTDEVDHRHKKVYMKNGMQYTLMFCTLDRLLQLNPQLIQINKSELVSRHVIKSVEHDLLTLNIVMENGRERQVTLSRTYKKNLLQYVA
jgi:hypothetical protein